MLPAMPHVRDRDDCPDWWAQFHLLCACSAARAGWLPRVMPASSLLEYIEQYDALHLLEARRIIAGLDVQFTADVQRQLYLPASRGGLGLRELARCAPAAALASWTVTFAMLRPHLATAPR
jgi:hypothetical protein